MASENKPNEGGDLSGLFLIDIVLYIGYYVFLFMLWIASFDGPPVDIVFLLLAGSPLVFAIFSFVMLRISGCAAWRPVLLSLALAPFIMFGVDYLIVVVYPLPADKAQVIDIASYSLPFVFIVGRALAKEQP